LCGEPLKTQKLGLLVGSLSFYIFLLLFMPRAVACECHLTVARIAIVSVLSLAGCVVESSLAKKREREASDNACVVVKKQKPGKDGGGGGTGGRRTSVARAAAKSIARTCRGVCTGGGMAVGLLREGLRLRYGWGRAGCAARRGGVCDKP
jgi:hypothetical protein